MIHKHPVGAFTLSKESTAPGLKVGRDQILAVTGCKAVLPARFATGAL